MKRIFEEYKLKLAKYYAELAKSMGSREYLEKAIELFKDKECLTCVEEKSEFLLDLIKEKRRLR